MSSANVPKWLLAAMIALAWQTPAIATSKLYRCSAKDVVVLNDDGTVGRYGNDFWKQHWTGIVVDTATAMLRRSDGTIERWTTLQQGSQAYDWVASPGKDLVSASTDLIRIRDWKESTHVTFLHFGLSKFVTGTCEILK